ncbi:MAG TPA: acyclic terpene utilization AtuA family protein [Nocardioidaceae bacterium]|nr:acyclic terpene utilization AtuA family protein [Nocardioidaceae bacterium]
MSDLLRVGNCSGFYGDRFGAMREMLDGGELDVLTGDYLAELTMLILGRDRIKDPALGYARTFASQLEDCLGLAVDRGVRIVSNAGGLNPAGLAERVREVASALGVSARVAYVEGDDLLPRAAELGFDDALSANAYLGGFGIAAALDSGADIVVTGRVTDASLTVGPAIWRFDWDRGAFDALAGATVAGHVIECGAQATGGNLAGEIDALANGLPGFPIAEIAADGSAVITKHPGTGGAVTVDSVTAQLVYEIDAPSYLGPDVISHLDTVQIAAEGPDRVRLSGTRGSRPPAELKVALNRLGGYRNSVEFLLTGLDIDAKASVVRRQLESALAGREPESIEWQLVDLTESDPTTQDSATARLRCLVKDSDPKRVGRRFSGAAVELALSSYAGFTLTAPPGDATPYGVYHAAYVDQAEIQQVVVLDDGALVVEPAAPGHVGAGPTSLAGSSLSGQAHPRTGADTPRTDLRRVPLGAVALARSGDKGGDANVGVWIGAEHPRRDAAYDWLVELLTPDRVRVLLPEAKELDVETYPLPNLRAVNIVVRGLLGEGVAASTRLDPQAKALGEWLRARHVDVPEELL